ncbi:hypothetical protein A1O3_10529 [Capronia epimyces CBS 606.96]|uniref:Uncharacterized protein n=1 Tax=Capronia epimyces CBS 606.96 TaxID=1182542 RepID=W9Y370_9EURO|nr:uncharacterized protein A1O3_10529 [Capronia epimyces CBS 606.96]EXJ76884.1 hypothetical protein A1O3_10529 [Capronia epimyces CBS 606.96]
MTVEHVILKCRRWNELRARVIRNNAGDSLAAILSTRQGCLEAARLVLATDLLAQYRNYREVGEEGDEGEIATRDEEEEMEREGESEQERE